MAKIVAFASYKGGTGKTTLAYNMVERAGAAGLRACLCDYDPQHVAAGFERVRRDQMSCGRLSPDTPGAGRHGRGPGAGYAGALGRAAQQPL